MRAFIGHLNENSILHQVYQKIQHHYYLFPIQKTQQLHMKTLFLWLKNTNPHSSHSMAAITQTSLSDFLPCADEVIVDFLKNPRNEIKKYNIMHCDSE